MNELGLLTDIIKETHNQWRFIFESPLYDEIKYTPGQLITLTIREPGAMTQFTRSYSIASWPDGSNTFELIITNLEGGRMCDYLFNKAKIGDEVEYRGPMGVFTLPEKIDRDIYFVCTGSGISPFRSMINWITKNNIKTKKIKLIFGTRVKEDTLYYEELRQLEKDNANFEYLPVLSREEVDGYDHGYVHDVYLKLIEGREDKPLFYLCGWNIMIEEARYWLDTNGYKMKEDIRVEIFG